MKGEKMLKRTKIILSSAITPVIALMGNKASALSITGTGYAESSTDLASLINNIISTILGIAALVSVIYIIIGGFNYITSSGNAEKVQGATKTITYAIIGLVIVALAFAIKTFVVGKILGTTTVNLTPTI